MRRTVKRIMDVAISGCTVASFSPVLLGTSALVFMSIGRPVFFLQERAGRDGRIFVLYKFRTMKDGRGKDGEILPDSVRLTKLGRVMRRLSIDEIPQLFNVLAGDMSIVGPRPLLVEYLSKYSDRHKLRHEMKPGLTGLSQINWKENRSWEEKLDDDVDYVENWGLALDAYIMAATPYTIVKRFLFNNTGETTSSRFDLVNRDA